MTKKEDACSSTHSVSFKLKDISSRGDHVSADTMKDFLTAAPIPTSMAIPDCNTGHLAKGGDGGVLVMLL